MTNINQQIHDIRKPLNSISMQAELIKMLSEACENSPKLQESANKIIQNAKHCSELLQVMFDDISSNESTGNNSSVSNTDAKLPSVDSQ